ncbi:MAG: alkaline phosphatase family protein [Candidatus Schekmanbacteria bacterium]|nr:alkaline phosphatase family protein [Candidatus Schekmanbacteria bacterium]
MTKLLVIGLDCATPQLVFDSWLDELPNLKSLVESGIHGKLRSTVPPITVPAWTAMMTSQDPGMLGFYGFRNRKSYGYDDLYFANANYVKAKTVWNHLSRNRMSSLVFGVPQTYPPKPLNGVLVACFLTPNKDVQYTYPDEIKAELDKAADGDYIIDVDDFRTDDKQKLLESIYVMSRRRFKAFRHFLTKGNYDFAMMVEMGIDRIHHGFWRYFDEAHRLYEPGNPFENSIKDYYKDIDREIGETLKVISPDTSVMVVSDHGAKTMMGAICINEWFQQEGYLTLKEKPSKVMSLKMNMIDWSKTKVWGEGGYYSRIFFNVKGREPEGVIPQEQYEDFRNEIIRKLEAMKDENGKLINNKVFKPEDVYKECNNVPPDLILYPGNLDWRSAGSVGTGTIHIYENDTGPDDANHAEDGIFIWKIPGKKWDNKGNNYSIYDIAPSILKYFGLDIPQEMVGKPII